MTAGCSPGSRPSAGCSPRAYVDGRWWPLLLPGAFALLATAAAYASASPVGLAVRLHRTQLAAWAVGLVTFGSVFGTLPYDGATSTWWRS